MRPVALRIPNADLSPVRIAPCAAPSPLRPAPRGRCAPPCAAGSACPLANTGSSTAMLTMQVLDDGGFDSKEEMVLTLQAPPGYTIGTPGSAQVEIEELPVTIPQGCNCGGGDLLGIAPGHN